MSTPKIRPKEQIELSGKETMRSTLTDIPVLLHNKFLEVTLHCGMTKREATMIGWMLFMRKVGQGKKIPHFKKRGYLHAKLRSVLPEETK